MTAPLADLLPGKHLVTDVETSGFSSQGLKNESTFQCFFSGQTPMLRKWNESVANHVDFWTMGPA